jgi:folate-dependent phosphoribosylglycinamide formyltransferase PurN
MNKPRLIIFASGAKGGGGSGFKKLVEASRSGILNADVVAVVSNHEHGGVREKADELQIPFYHSPYPRSAADYKDLVHGVARADFVALSGWLGRVEGLDPRITFNIHPAYLPSKFGGKGFYGHRVHEAVIAAYKNGEVSHSGVTMHFATEEYDNDRTIFFRRKVEILPDDTPDSLGKRVNGVEHEWQARITNDVIEGRIKWDGMNPSSIIGANLD